MNTSRARSSRFTITAFFACALFCGMATLGVALEASLASRATDVVMHVANNQSQSTETELPGGGMDSHPLPSSAELTQLTPMLPVCAQNGNSGRSGDLSPATAPVSLTIIPPRQPLAQTSLGLIRTSLAEQYSLLGQKPSGTA